MRVHDSLTRLAAVGPLVEPAFDAGEEDRILERILATPRSASTRRVLALVLVSAAVFAAAAVAVSLELGSSDPSITSGGRHVALTGARIQMAGYHFRTPAGFAVSSGSCEGFLGLPDIPPSGGAFATAASADGSCVQAVFVGEPVGSSLEPFPSSAIAVDVGTYRGYLESLASDQKILNVRLPDAGGTDDIVYLRLYGKGLSEDQLIAIALSGLPASP